MKIEQLIVQHLYSHKQVTLQGIGTIFLNPAITLPTEGDKDFLLPENAFSFEFNLKSTEDDALINYIVEHTRKIKPLASADLESYLILSKQFLNIGKPIVIEGVGTIQKSQQGNYEFHQGVFISPRIDDIPRQLREKREESVSFESEKRPNNNRRNLLTVAAVAVTALIALAIFYFVSNSNNSEPAQQAEQPIFPIPPVDTPKIKTDSLNTMAPVAPVVKDSNNFRIIIKEFQTAIAAQKAFDKLTTYGHKLELIKVDSALYKIAMPFKTPLSDTLRAKDSLKRFFNGNPYVQL